MVVRARREERREEEEEGGEERWMEGKEMGFISREGGYKDYRAVEARHLTLGRFADIVPRSAIQPLPVSRNCHLPKESARQNAINI